MNKDEYRYKRVHVLYLFCVGLINVIAIFRKSLIFRVTLDTSDSSESPRLADCVKCNAIIVKLNRPRWTDKKA